MNTPAVETLIDCENRHAQQDYPEPNRDIQVQDNKNTKLFHSASQCMLPKWHFSLCAICVEHLIVSHNPPITSINPQMGPAGIEKKRLERLGVNVMPSDNHLRNSLATQRLATNKFLLLQGRERIKHSGKKEEDGTSNQATSTLGKTDKLDTTQDGVNEGAHPVGCKAADKGIEFRGCGTNSEEEGYFNEEDYECRGTETS